MKKILGIDPGTERTGYAVIGITPDKAIKCYDLGCIYTSKDKKQSERILELSSQIKDIAKKHKIKTASIEQIFFFKNIKTAIKVSEARGGIMLELAKSNIEIIEFTPLQVKMALVGYGRADKKQVQEMVKEILNLKSIPKPDDAADAVAIAVCGARKMKLI